MMTQRQLYANVSASGAFQTSIPITIPAGAGGVQPSLALNYSSTSGNGIAGMGWNLSGLPVITRMPYGDGIKYDGSDTYAGPSGRLVDVSGNKTAYHGSSTDWTKYVPSGTCGDSPCSWTAYANGGGKLYYGTTADSRIAAAHPDCASGVCTNAILTWAVSKVEDVHGNYYEVTYLNDATNGDYYPSTITYTKGNGLSTFRTVNFTYETRPDYSTTYYGGKITTDQRLKRIEVKSNGQLVRRYELYYNASPMTGRSLLLAVRMYGADGTSYLKDTALSYTNGTGHNFGGQNYVESFFSDTNGFSDVKYYSTISYGDINGDGRVDICGRKSNGVYCALNQAGAHWGSATLWTTAMSDAAGWNLPRHYQTVRLVDVNGDGKADVCGRGASGIQCALSTGGGFGTLTTWSTVFANASGWDQVQHYSTINYVDVNDDQLPDVCGRSTGGVTCYANTGSAFGATFYSAGSFSDANGWNAAEYYSTIRMLDINGDGLTDICGRRGVLGIWCAKKTSASGNFEVYTQWTPANVFNASWSQEKYYKSIQYPDINSDGLPDVCGRGTAGFECYVNIANRFAPAGFTGLGLFTDAASWDVPKRYSTIRWVDLNGDGYSDVCGMDAGGTKCSINTGRGLGALSVWTTAMGGGSWDDEANYSTYGFIGYNGDPVPELCGRYDNGIHCWRNNAGPADLLTSIHDARGGLTTVVYTSSSQFTTSGPMNGSGIGRIITGERMLVSWVGTAPQIPNVTYWTRYDYDNGRYMLGSFRTRANLGFSMHRVTDYQTGNYTVYTYFQVPPYVGTVMKSESYTAMGIRIGSHRNTSAPVVFRCNETGCTAGYIPGVHDITHSLQVRNSSAVSTTYDMGIGLYQSVSVAPSYDLYGNITQATAINRTYCGDGKSCSSIELSSSCAQNWLVNQLGQLSGAPRTIGLVYETKTYSDDGCATGNLLTHSRTYYDNQALGAVGARLLPTNTTTYMGNASSTGWADKTMSYDVHGQILSTTNAQGLATSQTYDAAFHVMPATSTDVMGRTSTVTYDARFNVPLTAINADGLAIDTTYDVYGRPTQILSKQGSTTLRKATSSYGSGGIACALNGCTSNNWTQSCAHYGANFSSSLCSKDIVDGLGRALRSESPGASGTRYVHTVYDPIGRPWKTSLPTYNSTTGQYWIETLYDAAGRQSSIIAPNGGITSYTYHDTTVILPSGTVTLSTVTNARGIKARSFFNDKGQVVKTTEGITSTSSGISVNHSYNGAGQLVSTTGPSGQVTTMTYNYVGQPIGIVDPNAGTSTFSYYTTPGQSGFGKLKTQIRPAANTGGQSTTETMTYDSYGRLGTKTIKEGTTTTSTTVLTYDEPVTFGAGRLTTASTTQDGHTVTNRFAYDIFGDVLVGTRDLIGPNLSLTNLSSTVTKDNLGRKVQVDYSDGAQYKVNYGAVGYVSNIQYKPDAASTLQTISTPSNYDVNGRVGQQSYGNGVSTSYNYDSATGYLTSLNTSKGSTNFVNLSYGFDLAGNITQIIDNRSSALSMTYTYDDLDRLTQASRTGQTLVYAFDFAGNLTRKDAINGAGQVVATNLSYAAGTNKLTSDGANTYTHSASGNVTTKGGTSYAYTAENMLKRVTIAGVVKAEHIYGHASDRAVKLYYKDASTTIKTIYLGEGWEIRQKWVNGALSGSQTTKYVRGIDGGQLAQFTTGVTLASLLETTQAQRYYAAASLYDRSAIGLLHRSRYLAAGILADSRLAPAAYAALLALVLLVLWRLYYRKQQTMLFRGWTGIIILVCGLGVACHNEPDTTHTQTAALLSGDTSLGLPLGTYYTHSNHLGSASVVTNSSGVEVTRMNYLPYGELDRGNSTGADVVTHKFTGQEWDTETDLYNYNARYYDPSIGRFTSADTIAPPGALGLNRYMYTLGNPVKYTDPSGHIPCSDPNGQCGGGGNQPPPSDPSQSGLSPLPAPEADNNGGIPSFLDGPDVISIGNGVHLQHVFSMSATSSIRWGYEVSDGQRALAAFVQGQLPLGSYAMYFYVETNNAVYYVLMVKGAEHGSYFAFNNGIDIGTFAAFEVPSVGQIDRNETYVSAHGMPRDFYAGIDVDSVAAILGYFNGVGSADGHKETSIYLGSCNTALSNSVMDINDRYQDHYAELAPSVEIWNRSSWPGDSESEIPGNTVYDTVAFDLFRRLNRHGYDTMTANTTNSLIGGYSSNLNLAVGPEIIYHHNANGNFYWAQLHIDVTGETELFDVIQ